MGLLISRFMYCPNLKHSVGVNIAQIQLAKIGNRLRRNLVKFSYVSGDRYLLCIITRVFTAKVNRTTITMLVHLIKIDSVGPFWAHVTK